MPLHARWAQMLLAAITEAAAERGLLVDCLPEGRTPKAILGEGYRGMILGIANPETLFGNIEPLLAAGLRVVHTTTNVLPRQLLPAVGCDLEALCALLLQVVAPYRMVGVLGNSSPLLQAAVEALRETGDHQVHWLTHLRRLGDQNRDRLDAWLADLPLDALVLTPAPMSARMVLQSPAWHGRAVLALQDDPSIALRLKPAVTGIDIGLGDIGRAAVAAILDESAWPPTWAVKMIPPCGVQERASTQRGLPSINCSATFLLRLPIYSRKDRA